MEIPETWIEFVRRSLPGAAKTELVHLCGGGSKRQFLRVGGAARPAVLMVNPNPPAADSGVDENDTWVYVAGLLRECGAKPPEVYAYEKRSGLILAEDVGDRLLQEEVLRRGKDSAWTEAVYRRLVRLLATVQVECGRNFDPARGFNPLYDGGFMYRCGGLYFAEHFLGRLCGIDTTALENELERLANLAGDTIGAQVFLYRDFQSRNVLLQGGEEPALRLLDFQGGRQGPPAYDLASLVFDPYVPLPQELRRELIESYPAVLAEHSPPAAAGFDRQFPLVAAHRLMQVLGAYAKLSLVDGKTDSLAYIPPALTDLRSLLEEDIFAGFGYLREVVAALRPEEAISRIIGSMKNI